VDTSGDVYALDAPNNRVEKLTPSGGSFTVSEFGPTGVTVAPFAVAVDTSDNHVLIARRAGGGTSEMLVEEYSGTGALLETYATGFKAGEGEVAQATGGGLATDPADGGIYLSVPSAVSPHVLLIQTPPTPVVTISAPTGITTGSATFHGTVDPEGTGTGYHFEYSANGASWSKIPTTDISVGNGKSPVAVEQTVSGLSHGGVYHVRLVATNSLSATISSTSSEVVFETVDTAPTVTDTLATPVGITTAKLTGWVNPNNSSTSYHYEWGTTTAYGNQAPTETTPFIGAGGQPMFVPVSVAGLKPATTYHFRLVATNALATTYGPDRTFTTLSGFGAPGTCPNEALRDESDIDPQTHMPFSAQLSECRAYEMVSPTNKGGSPMDGQELPSGGNDGRVDVIGAAGNGVTVQTTGIWPGPIPAPDSNLAESIGAENINYVLSRSSSGWEFVPMEPPASQVTNEYRWVSTASEKRPELVEGGGWLVAAPSRSQGLPSQHETLPKNLYLLELGGRLTEVLSGSASVEAASHQPASSLHVLIGGASSSLYEYVGVGHTDTGTDVPSVVGVDNSGTLISECGTTAASGASNAVSAAGSTVFFNAVGESSNCKGLVAPANNELFARIGEPDPGTELEPDEPQTVRKPTVTVNVAAAGSGSPAVCGSDACGVSEPITYQGASSNGSRVFFTTNQALLGADKDTGSDLYMCKLPGDGGPELAQSSAFVNPCPELVGVSVTGTTAAELEQVVQISEDGSHVYFTAKGVLTGENAEGAAPVAGGNNLYLWSEGAQRKLAFVATLPSAAPGESQTTPSGRTLVFTSTADLTPDDTSTVAQVFVYQAESEQLVRVSRGQDGYNNNGNTRSTRASIAQSFSSKVRIVSDDGAYVAFQSNLALTPEVHGGENNVYLWHDGNVSLISDGTAEGTPPEQPEGPGLTGIDASGRNVFFATAARLVGQDQDRLGDLYDARVEGGFPAPAVPECAGEACQGALAGSPFVAAIGSGVFPGEGNSAASGNRHTSKAPAGAKTRKRAQRLVAALKACRKQPKRARKACEARARRRYRGKAKSKQKDKGSEGAGGNKR